MRLISCSLALIVLSACAHKPTQPARDVAEAPQFTVVPLNSSNTAYLVSEPKTQALGPFRETRMSLRLKFVDHRWVQVTAPCETDDQVVVGGGCYAYRDNGLAKGWLVGVMPINGGQRPGYSCMFEHLAPDDNVQLQSI